jgi:uncharacterized protein
MPLLYLICLAFVVTLSGDGAAAAQPPPAADAHGFTVFLRGAPVGREDVTVRSEAGGVVISSTGRLSPPLDVITRRAEIRYSLDWAPELLTIEATARGADVSLRTTFANGEARSEGTQAGQPIARTDTVSPQTIVLPNLFFGSYEALARRLANAQPGAKLPAYIAPQCEIPVTLDSVVSERVQTGSTTFGVRRYALKFANPANPLGELAVQLTADDGGHLVRITVPSQSLDIVRDDVAASTSRTQTYSNPGDEPVTIPATGFNIAGTLTRPADTSKTARGGRLPAAVLLAGSGANDRDGVGLGVPTIGQIAGALARAGYLTVRYDKRGFGQTGGRAESATLGDYAEDARSVVRWLEKRKDVDPKRIVVLGHSEGAWVALLAAAREDRIKGVISLAAPGTTGAELVLEQQRNVLEQMKVSDAERQAKTELQKKIQSAVISGKGWDDVPPELRKQADTAWFRSLLAFDPARVADEVEQPILIVHGELDRQVPVAHAEKLAEIAKNGDSRAVELVTVRGVNHLLVPATTGEISEYNSLPDRNVSSDVTEVIVEWMSKTFM